MYKPALAKDLASYKPARQLIRYGIPAPWRLHALALAMLILTACNALNPLCGSSRPVPAISSLSSTTITLAQAQGGFVLTVTGKEFVASSVVIINDTTLATTVLSSESVQVTLPTDLISGPGTANVTVKTPAGNSGKVGCSSGGTSNVLTLTITT